MFFKRFLKPKWEHKNSKIRKQALEILDDSLSSTQDLYIKAAEDDADPIIRQYVVRRLLDLDVLQRVVAQDKDCSVRQIATQKMERMLTGKDSFSSDLDSRLAWVRASDNRYLLEKIARHGKEPVLRLEAMGRVGKEGLYGDLALTDSDASVRLRAVGLIHQKSTLERVYKQARNKDKRVRMLVQSRLQDIETEAQLPQRLMQKAKQLCLAAENITDKCSDAEGFKKQTSIWADLTQQWDALAHEGELDNQYVLRFDLVAKQLNVWRVELEKKTEDQACKEKEKEQIFKELTQFIDPLLQLEKRVIADSAPAVGLIDEIKATLVDVQTKMVTEVHLQSDLYQAVCMSLEQQVIKIEEYHRSCKRLVDVLYELTELKQSNHIESTSALLLRLEKRYRNIEIGEGLVFLAKSVADVESCILQIKTKIERAEAKCQTIIDDFKQGVPLLEEALLKGASKQAAEMSNNLSRQLKQLSVVEARKLKKKDIYQRYQRALNQVKELRDWQGWAALPVQEQLCEEIEKTREDVLAHQDDLDFAFDQAAKRINLLRKKWKGLGESQDKAAAQLLWVRFNEACNQAYEPCQAYFDRQTQQRDQNLCDKKTLSESLETCLEQLQSSEEVDWKNIDKQVRQGQQKWNAIGAVNRKDKAAVEDRFRKVMAALRSLLREESERNHKRKTSLIDEADGLYKTLESSDKSQQNIQKSVADMKVLQQRWKNTGIARNDKVLWEQFRALGDRIFGERQARYDDEAKERIMRFNHKTTLTIMLENIATLDGDELKQAQSQVKKIQQEWQEVGSVDRTKQNEADERFKQACKQCEQAFARLAQEEQQQEKLKIKEKSALCERVENLVEKCAKNRDLREHIKPELLSTQQAWKKMADLTEVKLNAALNQRYQMAYENGVRLCDSKSAQSQLFVKLDADRLKNLELKEKLCIQMETMAGVSSPESAKEQRMAYQVAQLANKMAIKAISGTEGCMLPKTEEVERLSYEWLTTGAIPANKRGELNERFAAAHQVFLRHQFSGNRSAPS